MQSGVFFQGARGLRAIRAAKTRLGSAALSIAALALSACTLDSRFLEAKPVDGGNPLGNADAAGGPHFKDSGDVTYSSDTGAEPLDTGAPHPPPPSNVGCMHFVGDAADCDKTLTVNSDFNSDDKGWDSSNGAVLRWVPFDSQAATKSGSLGVKNAQIGDFDGPVEGAATQCIPVAPDTIYDYAAAVYIKRGQVDGGQAQIEVWFYDTPNCEGLVHTPAYSLQTFYATNRWENLVSATSLAPPDPIKSQAVRLVVQKPFRSEPLEVLFDAVRVTARK